MARFGIWIFPANGTTTPATINAHKVNPSLRVAFTFELVPVVGGDGLTEGRYELHLSSKDGNTGGPAPESVLRQSYFTEARGMVVFVDGDPVHSWAILNTRWNLETERAEIALRRL